MAIPARLLRSFLPALVSAGLVLAACSSDSDDAPGPDTNQPGDGGSESNGGKSGSPAEQPEAGAPAGGSGDTGGTESTGGTAGGTTGGTAGTSGSNVGGEEPGTGGVPTEPGTGGMGGEETEPTGPSEGFLRGEQLAKDKMCATCHQADFGGVGLWPNISPDVTTGIGSWSDEEIGAAIRDGKDPEGANLCSQMMKYPLTDAELADLTEYLRGIPAVSRKITAVCPK